MAKKRVKAPAIRTQLTLAKERIAQLAAANTDLTNKNYDLKETNRGLERRTEGLEKSAEHLNMELRNFERRFGELAGELRGYRDGVTQITQKVLPIPTNPGDCASGVMGMAHCDDSMNYYTNKRRYG